MVTKKLDNVFIAKKQDTLKKTIGTKIKIPMFLSILTVKDMVILIKIAKTKIKLIIMKRVTVKRKMRKKYLASADDCSSYFWFLDSGCGNHMIGDKKLF